MPAEDVERFEVAAGELLEELGYPRAVPCPRPQSLERAARIRDVLAQDSNWNQIVSRAQADAPEPASLVEENELEAKR